MKIKKYLSRIVSLVLALAMCLSLCLTNVSAYNKTADGRNIIHEGVSTDVIKGTNIHVLNDKAEGIENDFTYRIENGYAVVLGWQGYVEYDEKEECWVESSTYDENTTTFRIPSTLGGYPVKKLGDCAFTGLKYTKVTKVIIPDGVTSIGQQCFDVDVLLSEEKARITQLNIPDSVSYVGPKAFFGTYITNLKTPRSLTTIGKMAFAGVGFRTLEIAPTVTRIESFAFSDGYNPYFDFYDKMFDENGEYTIPWSENLYRILYKTFYEPFAFDVTIPSGVTYIGDYAFASNPCLRSIYIPKSVQTLATNAFNGCVASLKAIYFGDSKTEVYRKFRWDVDKLNETYSKCVWGRKACYQLYCNAEGIPANIATTPIIDVYTSTTATSTKTQPMELNLSSKTYKVTDVKKKAKTFTIKPSKAQGKVTYKSNSKYVTVTSKGKVTVKKGTPEGNYTVTVTAAGNKTYKKGSKTVAITVNDTSTTAVATKTQPMKLNLSSKTYKVTDVKKKAKTFTIKPSKAQGKATYKSNSKYVTVTSAGKVTVKKGTPKGKYIVTVTAAGNKTYKKGSKSVTITVK